MSQFRDEIRAMIHAHQNEAFIRRVRDEREQYLKNPVKSIELRDIQWTQINDYRTLAGCKIAIPIEDKQDEY